MEYRTLGEEKVSLLGFGCMRFPVKKGKIDEEASRKMLERALEAGVTYFDTAWPYHDGKSEAFVGSVLSGFDRSRYQLATKLPVWLVHSREDARSFVEKQLANLRTDYIDFYLLHAMNGQRWQEMLSFGVPEALEECRAEGKIRKLGFSFHGPYGDFERILKARKWDFCQIQLNYMDVDDQAGKRGADLARELGIPVVIMEPLKGGSLAALPEDAMAPLRAINPASTAVEWALRFLAGDRNIRVLLSGMGSMEQLEENLRICDSPAPLNAEEEAALERAKQVLDSRVRNGCTACRYCMPCPHGVDIPRNFALWNDWGKYSNAREARWNWHNPDFASARADACVQCGECVPKCPQNIPIPADLSRAAAELSAVKRQ